MEAYENKRIVKIKGASIMDAGDCIAVEKKVRISVNERHLLSLYCTPLMVRELVVGIVHNEGLISGEWCAERISIQYGDEINADIPASGRICEGEKTITSGCAGGISMGNIQPDRLINDNSSFHVDSLKKIFRTFQDRSEVYKITGGVHSAALTNGEQILAFAEDIGRHNAVDKVIGYCILEHIPFKGNIMLASGRLSSEIVSKCALCGIPIVISRAAPTTLSTRIAESAGVTVVGFMRGDRMNVYTHSWRISI